MTAKNFNGESTSVIACFEVLKILLFNFGLKDTVWKLELSGGMKVSRAIFSRQS